MANGNDPSRPRTLRSPIPLLIGMFAIPLILVVLLEWLGFAERVASMVGGR
jgi:hypothetical protein